MKIFSAAQIKDWDAFTIANEPVASIDLMERAATACAGWISQNFAPATVFKVFCGKGNNGGDGLAIARLLLQQKFAVHIYIVEANSAGSNDFLINLQRLHQMSAEVTHLSEAPEFPEIKVKDVVIDALFGTGLNKKPKGISEKLITHLNKSTARIISIDIPSGLFTDQSSPGNAAIRARYTLSFQQQKLAFLVAENESSCGDVIVLDIGLSHKYYEDKKAVFEYITEDNIKRIYKPRKAFAHKGDYGYACLLAGSYGMMGAAVMSAKACLKSGVGKLTSYICKQGYVVMQTAVPEAMCKVFGGTFIKDVEDLGDFDVIGLGPGIGRHPSHKQLLQKVFKEFKQPVVIDADGLNMLSKSPSLYASIPAASIITPHPKEFERLFGKTENDFDTMDLALTKAKELNIYIVLKGHHPLIATPSGKAFLNSTGNSGMATAGAGDVLTGILTAFLAQKYNPLDACIMGVYLHGLAGDIAANKMSKEAMIADDIINYLGEGFKQIANLKETRSIS